MAYVQVRKQRITPLIEAVQKQDVDAARSRIEAGDDIEATDSYGQTALHWATKDKSVEIVQLLLDAGADPNAKDEDGDTPLHNAQKNANPAISEALAQLEGRSATGSSIAGIQLTDSEGVASRTAAAQREAGTATGTGIQEKRAEKIAKTQVKRIGIHRKATLWIGIVMLLGICVIVPVLIVPLKDSPSALACAMFGPLVIGGLLIILASRPPNVDKLLAKRDVDRLIWALGYKDASVRRSAAEALGEIGDARAAEPLCAALKDEDIGVAVEARGALVEIGAPAVDPLLDVLKDGDKDVCKRAAYALGKIGTPALDPLLAALKDDHDEVCWYAGVALGEMGAPALEPLCAALKDDNSSVRHMAALALGEIGDARAVEPLLTLFEDDDSSVYYTGSALGQIGDARAVEPLCAALKDDNWRVRNYAAIALGQIGDGRAFEPLCAALKDDSRSDVREKAAIALGRIGNPRAVEPLLIALKEMHLDMHTAARALVKIGKPAVVPLCIALQDDSYSVRSVAAHALEQLGVHPDVVKLPEAKSLEQRPREARTDLVADEKRISESVTINRSQQEIWDYITTPQTWKMWFVEDDLIDVIPDWQEGGVLNFASGQKPKIDEYEPPALLRWGNPYIRLTGIEASVTKVEYGYVAQDALDDDPGYWYEFKRLYTSAIVEILDRLESLMEESDGATKKGEEQARRPPEQAPKKLAVGKTAVWVEQEMAQAHDAETLAASPESEQKEPAEDDLSLAAGGALTWSQQLDRAPGESDAAYQERMAASVTPMTEQGVPGPARPRLIRVFVSSTFRDMQAEREELVKQVFPQLRKLCEQRGVTWSEVDLRWGITSEQAAEGQVLPICLDEIQRCRPYFIGLLGQRYGWVPDEIPGELVEREPWLAQHLDHSITELEILHGVLNDPAMAEQAFFYFRDPAYTDTLPPGQRGAYREDPTPDEIERYGPEEAERRADKRREKLQALKNRITASGFPVEADYRDPVTLGELVLRDMTAVIDRLFPEGSEPGPLDREALEHEAFAASRTGVYVGRQAYLDRLNAHLQGDGPPLVVLGESGSGKSALLANWVQQVRATHSQGEEPAPATPARPGSGKTAMLANLASQVRARPSHDLLLVHFIGATAHSADWAAMLRRIMGEFRRCLGIGGEIPSDPHELRAAFANWLHLAATGGRAVLVLDGLDQLEDRDAARELVWLPSQIPTKVRLVLSTLPGQPLDELKKRGWPTLHVEPLEPEERKRLIVRALAHYTKALSPAQIERIAGVPQAANPLYLRALLEELRIFGLHEELDQRIEHYLAATTPEALYDKILERYEGDYQRDQPGLVREAMQLLWAARRGLAEAELLDLLGADGEPLPGAYWSPLYLAAEASLASRSGLIGFFHDYLRQAVGKRYLPTGQEQRAAHRRLADYFESRALSARQVDELPWQLAQAESWTRLYRLLGDLSFFAAAWKVDPFEVKAFWAQIEANSELLLVDAYEEAVEAPEQYVHHAWDLAILLHDTGHHDQALRLRRFLVEHYRQTGDSESLAGALGNLATILHDLGDLDEALILLREEENLCRERGDAKTLANTLGNQALILLDSGDLDGALALHREEQRLCQEQDNRDGVARSLGNQGRIATARGDLDRALALFKEQERLCRELGNRDGMATALGNQGTVLLKRGDLDGAMALFEAQERICCELGNRDGQAKALGNRGVILKMGGDLEGAMALYRRVERIFRDLGEESELAGALGNQALVLRARGDLDGAMALFKEQERICRELSKKEELQLCLGNQALVLGDLGQLAEAMTLLKEQERICRDLDSREGLQRSLGEQANILTDMGELKEAMALHQEKERICRELGHPKGLAIALSNQASILAAWGRPRQALPLAEEAVRLLTTHGFTRIAAQVMLTLQDVQSQVGSPGQDSTELPSQPANAEAHHNRAVNLLDQGRLDEAVREFQAALRIQPDLAEAHHGLGLVYGRQGLVPEAMAEFQTALRLKPDYAEAHYNLGVLYAGQGRLDEAIGEFQAALRVEPDHVGARNNLGVAYGKQGRLDEAAREYKAALDSKPDCAEAHYNLGVNYGTRGLHDQALREFQAAVRIKPDYVEAHNNLAVAYWQGGRREEATQQWRIAAQLGSAQARQVLAQLDQG